MAGGGPGLVTLKRRRASPPPLSAPCPAIDSAGVFPLLGPVRPAAGAAAPACPARIGGARPRRRCGFAGRSVKRKRGRGPKTPTATVGEAPQRSHPYLPLEGGAVGGRRMRLELFWSSA